MKSPDKSSRKSSKSIRRFQCQECSTHVTSKYKLTEHMRIHTGERLFKCSHCSLSFKQTSGLKKHEKIHRGERKHRCSHPNCSFSSVHASSLKVHARRMHEKLKLYDCPDCSEKFYTTEEVKSHRIQKHGVARPFPCSQCAKAFLTRAYMNRHLKASHGILLPYSCSTCDQSFRLKLELLLHETSHKDDSKTMKTTTTQSAQSSASPPPDKRTTRTRKNQIKVKSPGSRIKQRCQDKKKPKSKVNSSSSSRRAASQSQRVRPAMSTRNKKSNDSIAPIETVHFEDEENCAVDGIQQIGPSKFGNNRKKSIRQIFPQLGRFFDPVLDLPGYNDILVDCTVNSVHCSDNEDDEQVIVGSLISSKSINSQLVDLN